MNAATGYGQGMTGHAIIHHQIDGTATPSHFLTPLVLQRDSAGGGRLKLERVIDVPAEQTWNDGYFQAVVVDQNWPTFRAVDARSYDAYFDGALAKLVTQDPELKFTFFTSGVYQGQPFNKSIYPKYPRVAAKYFTRATGYLEFDEQMMIFWRVILPENSYQGAEVFVLTCGTQEHNIIQQYNARNGSEFQQVNVNVPDATRRGLHRFNGQWLYNDYGFSRMYTNIAVLRNVNNELCTWDAVEHMKKNL